MLEGVSAVIGRWGGFRGRETITVQVRPARRGEETRVKHGLARQPIETVPRLETRREACNDAIQLGAGFAYS